MDESSAVPNINMKDDPSVKLTIRLIMQGKVSQNFIHHQSYRLFVVFEPFDNECSAVQKITRLCVSENDPSPVFDYFVEKKNVRNVHKFGFFF